VPEISLKQQVEIMKELFKIASTPMITEYGDGIRTSYFEGKENDITIFEIEKKAELPETPKKGHMVHIHRMSGQIERHTFDGEEWLSF